ncbi:MAG: GNAT family N-acetyltransferase [Burkholderiales bacterium]|nr:GNAT family N-acetyltransferase [Burkholderiales bacterium]
MYQSLFAHTEPLITIREAVSHDYIWLQHIYQRSFLEADWLPASSQVTRQFSDVSAGEKIFVALRSDATVVGLISVYEDDAYIHHLYVLPEAQQSGVGRALLESLHAWLPQPWRLKCLVDNFRALRFYQSMGFEEIDSGTSASGDYFLLSRED